MNMAASDALTSAPLHIDSCGNGPDLVLLHGWAMHGGVFDGLVEHLRDRFRVHRVDLPGHGLSHDASSRGGAAGWARTIAAQLPPAIWAGWSLGGLVALHAALDQPERVRGLAMIAATPRFVASDDWPDAMPPAALDLFAQQLQDNHAATALRFLSLQMHGEDATALRHLRRLVLARGAPAGPALQSGLDMLANNDLRDRLGKLEMPQLWLAGRRDRLVPAAAMRTAAACNERARFVQLPTGHMPFITHARQVADALEELADVVSTS